MRWRCKIGDRETGVLKKTVFIKKCLKLSISLEIDIYMWVHTAHGNHVFRGH